MYSTFSLDQEKKLLSGACCTLGAIALGFMSTTVQAADNLLSNSNAKDTLTEVGGLHQINYLKIPGYASASGIYTPKIGGGVSSIGNATGSLKVYGTPAGGRILRAVLNSLQDDGEQPTDVTYTWLRQQRQPANANDQCDYSITRAKVLPTGTPTPGTSSGESNWCVVSPASNNSAEYTLKQSDVYHKIAVQISYTDNQDNEEQYSQLVDTGTSEGICLRDFNFASDTNACTNLPLLQDSYE